ncbi:unnamed protein product [Lactuca virosa]|uniref:Uncharacterized protein n=1 Tax=Lactuca virosa TaxID=75947 RepID=A0AAU9MPD6_9ASTR|nr:unnamed protein product [Lactuca virosa]
MAGAVVDGSMGVWLLLIVRKNEGGRSCSHRRGWRQSASPMRSSSLSFVASSHIVRRAATGAEKPSGDQVAAIGGSITASFLFSGCSRPETTHNSNSRRWLTGIDVGKNVWVWLLTEIVRLFGLGDSKKLKKGETIVLLFHLTEKCKQIQKDRSIFLCERKTWGGKEKGEV